jgi:phosphatidylserine decarboxylase
MNGVVSYYKYHPGKKLFAINPKSSELNERNTLVVKDEQGREVLFRQIAGVMARRIICHVDKGAAAKVGEEFGLIRFGSRVDFFLPIDSEINVKIGDKVKGKISVLAHLK